MHLRDFSVPFKVFIISCSEFDVKCHKTTLGECGQFPYCQREVILIYDEIVIYFRLVSPFVMCNFPFNHDTLNKTNINRWRHQINEYDHFIN